MKTELQKRVQTALAGAIVLLLVIIFGGWLGIYLVTAVLSLGMVYEFSKIIFSMPDATEKRYVLLSAAWFAIVADLLSPRSQFEVLLLVFFGLAIYFLTIAGRYESGDLNPHFKELMGSIFGVIYLVFLPLFLPLIHESLNGVHWTILYLLVVWGCDVGGYFAGKRWGRTKLYEKISPKKTLEGAAGGLGLGVLVSIVYKLLFFRAASWGTIIIVPLLVGPVAMMGDLVESFFKRAYSVKDSGSILPGHGGFLDRFDAVVFALPIMYACLRVFS